MGKILKTLFHPITVATTTVMAVPAVMLLMISGTGATAGGADDSCGVVSTTTTTADGNSTEAIVDGDTLSKQLVNAKKINTVAAEFGLDKNKRYGAIGNAMQESSLLEPFVETMFHWSIWKDATDIESAKAAIEKYGTKAEDLFVDGWNSIIQVYGGGIDEPGYRGGSPDGSHWVGFGVWQNTGYNGVMPYFDWADANNIERVNLDNYLAFTFGDNSDYFKPYTSQGDYYYKRLESIMEMEEPSSPAAGATMWLDNYEYAGTAPRGSWVHLEQRQQYAIDWAVRLEKEVIDSQYAKSILSKANTSSARKDAASNAKTKSCGSSSSSKANGGHPYAKDYYWTAAFRQYNKAGTIAASNTGNNFHNGVDLVADWSKTFGPKDDNKELYSIFDGVVINKRSDDGSITIKSTPEQSGMEEAVVVEYAHMLIDTAYNQVNVGDVVKAGDRIGTEGDTYSPGLHHLHLAVYNAAKYESYHDVWWSQPDSAYGQSASDKIIDPSVILDGLEPGWFDVGSSNYLGDEFIQPNPLRIRVDGTTKEDPRLN